MVAEVHVAFFNFPIEPPIFNQTPINPGLQNHIGYAPHLWQRRLEVELTRAGLVGIRFLDPRGKTMTQNNLIRMDNVGIVVESLDDAIFFFSELGLKLEGRAMIEGEWAGRVTGLGNQHVEIAMMVTPDGHSRLEISRFLAPAVVSDHRNAPVNALGYLRVMFTVANIDETVARLCKVGAQIVGEVVQYENSYRLCYIRGPEGILIGLAEQLGNK